MAAGERVEALIVAPWGKPVSWRKVEYSVEKPANGEVEEHQYHETYRSTLAPLLRAFPSSITLVLVSDTLLEVTGIESLNSYEEVKKRVEEYVSGHLRSEEYSGGLHERAKVHVLPGIGVFRQAKFTVKAIGTPLLYMAAALHAVAEALLKLKPRRLVVDISHGINYMPLMTYRASLEAAHVYALIENKDLEVLLYNSDPVSSDGDHSVLHLVERFTVSRMDALARAYDALDRLKPPKKLVGNLVRLPPALKKRGEELGKHVRELRGSVGERLSKLEGPLNACKSFTAAAKKGLPLYLAYKLDELEQLSLDDALGWIGELVDRAVLVEKAEGEVRLLHLTAPGPELVDLALSAALAHALASNSTGGGGGPYSLKRLREIAEGYVVERAAKTIAMNELDDMEKRLDVYTKLSGALGELPTSGKVPYKLVYELANLEVDGERLIDLYRKSGLSSEVCARIRDQVLRLYEELRNYSCKPGSVDKRNFYAHAGLERHTVAVVLGSENALEYYSECMSIVKSYAEE